MWAVWVFGATGAKKTGAKETGAKKKERNRRPKRQSQRGRAKEKEPKRQSCTNSSERGDGRSLESGPYRIQDVSQTSTLLGYRKRGAIDRVPEEASLNVGVFSAKTRPERGIPVRFHSSFWLVIFRLVGVDPAICAACRGVVRPRRDSVETSTISTVEAVPVIRSGMHVNPTHGGKRIPYGVSESVAKCLHRVVVGVV